MVINNLFIPFLLGLTGGLIPGPIIAMTFKEMVDSPSQPFRHFVKFPLYAAFSEAIIGITLIATSRSFKIPEIVFDIFSLVGSFILIKLALHVFKSTVLPIERKQIQSISFKYVFLLMFFNGAVWLFWLTVCLPLVEKIKNELLFGDVFFIILFELGVVMGMSAMIMTFRIGRGVLTNPRVIKKVNFAIALFLIFLSLKLVYSGGANLLKTIFNY